MLPEQVRELIFLTDSMYNVQGRVTNDLDFAVQVNSWLRTALVFFKPT